VLAEYDADLARCRHLLAEVARPDLASVVLLAEMSRVSLDRDWTRLAEMAVRFRDAYWGRHFNSLIALCTARRAQGRVAEVVDELVSRADPAFAPLRPLAVLAAAEAGAEDRARHPHPRNDAVHELPPLRILPHPHLDPGSRSPAGAPRSRTTGRSISRCRCGRGSPRGWACRTAPRC
jgi:hypothetical protein